MLTSRHFLNLSHVTGCVFVNQLPWKPSTLASKSKGWTWFWLKVLLWILGVWVFVFLNLICVWNGVFILHFLNNSTFRMSQAHLWKYIAFMWVSFKWQYSSTWQILNTYTYTNPEKQMLMILLFGVISGIDRFHVLKVFVKFLGQMCKLVIFADKLLNTWSLC